jgi:hypothetical protein
MFGLNQKLNPTIKMGFKPAKNKKHLPFCGRCFK